MSLPLFIASLLLCAPLMAAPVGVYAPVEAPYQLLDSQRRPDGFAVKVVRMVLQEVGSDAQIELMPSVRIQATRLSLPNQLIFTEYRNRDTEHQYKWVGAIVPFRIYVYRLKSRPDIQVSDVASLANYSVGVVRGGGRYRYLTHKGMSKNLDTAPSDESNIRKFFAGRIDILLEDPVMLRYAAKLYGFGPAKAEIVSELTDLAGEGYLAFSPGKPDALVQTYTAALEKVQASQAYADLLRQYGLVRAGERNPR
jgi:polar amino acid transport system substrate-binding protein